jgi:alpha,alpha-trehalose-phosphate synthase [UDP-forming]/trehalose-phosphatase
MNLQGDAESAYWLALARHRPLGILTDLDGTLLPFAPTPEEARPTAELVKLVSDLASSPETTLVVVSGRPRGTLEEYFPPPQKALFVAEHGAWRSGAAGWERMVSLDERAVDALETELGGLAKKYAGAMLERKTWSVALHYRKVPPHEKTGLLVQAATIVDSWMRTHGEYEALGGAEVLEVRPRAARKANAVSWIRGLLGPSCRLLIAGDDLTDEDMFGAAAENDATVLVGAEPDRHTAARWRLGATEEVHALYRWILSQRREATSAPPSRRPSRVPTLPDAAPGGHYDLLILSNRLPELRSAEGVETTRKRNVGGLVSALTPALASRKGIWLGWSGRTRPEATATELGLSQVNGLAFAWVDFPDAWHRHYYNGLCNSALWPLFHSFPSRLTIAHEDWRAYEAANEAFASLATRLVRPGATIWAHDYHLLLLGTRLRAHGHTGPIGLFQHIPFPGPDILFLLPWATQILEAMFQFDMVGFHTASYVDNFLRCMATLPGVRIEGLRVVRGERSMTAGAFPIGIIPEDFQETGHTAAVDEIAGLMRSIQPSRLVLGVDRLDYTKGIPERLLAFGRFLEIFPEWRRKACLVQVSVPSRGDVPEYVEQRSRVENIVGRVNGEFGEADWVPIRYLYRSYARSQLSELYRAADVGYVTPLRDGMNLVAKEFVAAQDPAEPGVLLLSRFAGAAEELTAALLTNPWDTEGMARDLERSLLMSKAERLERYRSLMEVISRTTAVTWAEGFLTALGSAAHRP